MADIGSLYRELIIGEDGAANILSSFCVFATSSCFLALATVVANCRDLEHV